MEKVTGLTTSEHTGERKGQVSEVQGEKPLGVKVLKVGGGMASADSDCCGTTCAASICPDPDGVDAQTREGL
jgi:hypothetical protein